MNTDVLSIVWSYITEDFYRYYLSDNTLRYPYFVNYFYKPEVKTLPKSNLMNYNKFKTIQKTLPIITLDQAISSNNIHTIIYYLQYDIYSFKRKYSCGKLSIPIDIFKILACVLTNDIFQLFIHRTHVDNEQIEYVKSLDVHKYNSIKNADKAQKGRFRKIFKRKKFRWYHQRVYF